MIFEDALLAWQKHAPWRNIDQVEQDLILHAAIQAIFAEPFLAERLAFRGGTCLNKLFWKTPQRYSEDIDLVQINAENIGPTVNAIREALSDIFEKPPQWDRRRAAFRFHYAFVPENNQYAQRVKIEINTREHFCVAGHQHRVIRLDSPWRHGEADITTFSLEELLATKLRALYQRRKGRDLFDLWKSQELRPDYGAVADGHL